MSKTGTGGVPHFGMKLPPLVALTALLVSCTATGEPDIPPVQRTVLPQVASWDSRSTHVASPTTVDAQGSRSQALLEGRTIESSPSTIPDGPYGPHPTEEQPSFHLHESSIARSVARPEPPNQLDPPIDIAVWVADIVLSAPSGSENQATAASFMAEPLAEQFAGSEGSTREGPLPPMVLIDARFDEARNTTTAVHIDLVFERSESNHSSEHVGVDLVFVEVRLHLVQTQWEIVELTISGS